MSKDAKIFVGHMLENVGKVNAYMAGVGKASFLRNERLQDAVMRRLEVIGEAAKQVPKEFRDEHPAIPWVKIAGFRDKLIHHYFGIDLELIFEVASVDAPKLERQLAELLTKAK